MYTFKVGDGDDYDDDDALRRRNSYNTSTSISLPSSCYVSSSWNDSGNNILVESNATLVKEDGTVGHDSLFDGITYSQRQHKINYHSGSTLLLNDIEEEESLEIDDYGRIVRSTAGSRAAAARRVSPSTLMSDFSVKEREQLVRQHNYSLHSKVASQQGRENHPHSPRRKRGRDPSVVENINFSPRPASSASASADPEHTPEINSCDYDGSTISGSATYAGTLSASTITFDNHSNPSSKERIPHQVNILPPNKKGTKIIFSNLPKNDNTMRVIIEDKSYQDQNIHVTRRGGRTVNSSSEESERGPHHGGGMRPAPSKYYRSTSTQEWERNELFTDVSHREKLPSRNKERKDDPPEEEEEDDDERVEEDVAHKPRPPLRKPHEAKSRETMVGRGKSTSRSVKSRSTITTPRSETQSRSSRRSSRLGEKKSVSKSSRRNNVLEDRLSRSKWNDAQSRSTLGSGQTFDSKSSASSSSSSSSRRSIVEDRLRSLNEVKRRERYTRDRMLMKDRSIRSHAGQSRSTSRSGRSGGQKSSSLSSRNHFRDTRSGSRSPESKWDSTGGDYYEDKDRSGRRRQLSRRSWKNTDRCGEDYEDYDNTSSSSSHRNSRRRSEDAPSYHSGGASVLSHNSQGSVRRDIDDEGYCLHHPDIRLMKLRRDDTWRVLRKRCPECLKDTLERVHKDGKRPRSDSSSKNKNHTPLDSDSVDNSSSPSLEHFNGIGLRFQMPEELEAEEATNRLKRRLAARAYHFPGNSWCQDWMQYISNTHTVLGLFFHHPLHPMGFQERLVMLFGSIAIGLTISNFTYIWFLKNEYSVKVKVMTFTLKGLPEIGITKLMLVLWTLGSFLHTLFDLLLWHLKACTICRYRGRIDNRLLKWGRVVGLFIVMITVGAGGYAVLLRASIEYDGEDSVADQVEESILSNELYGIQYDDKRDFGFLAGYLIEFLLALFVYYPLAITILFSGVLGCGGRVPILGGRPREMKKEERYELSKRRPRILNAGKATEENHIV